MKGRPLALQRPGRESYGVLCVTTPELPVKFVLPGYSTLVVTLWPASSVAVTVNTLRPRVHVSNGVVLDGPEQAVSL